MIDIKVNASFILQGGVLPAEHSCSKNEKRKKGKEEKKKESTNDVLYEKEVIRLKDGKQIVINLRAPKPATQTLKLSSEAYNYMISEESVPYGMKLHDWKRLNKKQRVSAHLKLIAESLNAKLDYFTVLGD